MSKKILVIASDFPYPPNHGGRVDVFERIKTLKELKFEIYLISTIKTLPSKDKLLFMNNLIKENIFIHRKQSVLKLWSLYPYQVSSRNNAQDITDAIQNINDIEFDVCLIEGHYCLDIFNNIFDNCRIKKSYLRIHNNETKYFK